MDMCSIEKIDDVRTAQIDLNLFEHIDTSIVIKDSNDSITAVIKYTLIYSCDNGTVIMGNVNERGQKHGKWSIKCADATMREGNIVGSFWEDEMDGNWQNGVSYGSRYDKGKWVKTTRITF